MTFTKISTGDAIIISAILSLNHSLPLIETILKVSVSRIESNSVGRFVDFAAWPNFASASPNRRMLDAVEVLEQDDEKKSFGAILFMEFGLPSMLEYFTFGATLPEYARLGSPDAVLKRYRRGSIDITGRAVCENAIEVLRRSANHAGVLLVSQLSSAIQVSWP